MDKLEHIFKASTHSKLGKLVKAQGLKTDSKNNLFAEWLSFARKQADAWHQAYLNFLMTEFPNKEIEVSNNACRDENIRNCVYVSEPGTLTGYGRRKCIYCDTDDHDEL